MPKRKNEEEAWTKQQIHCSMNPVARHNTNSLKRILQKIEFSAFC